MAAENEMRVLTESMSRMARDISRLTKTVQRQASATSRGVQQGVARMQGDLTNFAIGNRGGGKESFWDRTFTRRQDRPPGFFRDIATLWDIQKEPLDVTREESYRRSQQNMRDRLELLRGQAIRYGGSAAAFYAGNQVGGPIAGFGASMGAMALGGIYTNYLEESIAYRNQYRRWGERNILAGDSLNRQSGLGWSRAQVRELGQWRARPGRYSESPFKKEEIEEIETLAQELGFFKGVTETGEFKDKMDDLIEDTKMIMQTFHTTREKAVEVMANLNKMGVKDFKGQIARANVAAAYSGMSQNQIIQYAASLNQRMTPLGYSDAFVNKIGMNLALNEPEDLQTETGAVMTGLNDPRTTPLLFRENKYWDQLKGMKDVSDEEAAKQLGISPEKVKELRDNYGLELNTTAIQGLATGEMSSEEIRKRIGDFVPSSEQLRYIKTNREELLSNKGKGYEHIIARAMKNYYVKMAETRAELSGLDPGDAGYEGAIYRDLQRHSFIQNKKGAKSFYENYKDPIDVNRVIAQVSAVSMEDYPGYWEENINLKDLVVYNYKKLDQKLFGKPSLAEQDIETAKKNLGVISNQEIVWAGLATMTPAQHKRAMMARSYLGYENRYTDQEGWIRRISELKGYYKYMQSPEKLQGLFGGREVNETLVSQLKENLTPERAGLVEETIENYREMRARFPKMTDKYKYPQWLMQEMDERGIEGEDRNQMFLYAMAVLQSKYGTAAEEAKRGFGITGGYNAGFGLSYLKVIGKKVKPFDATPKLEGWMDRIKGAGKDFRDEADRVTEEIDSLDISEKMKESLSDVVEKYADTIDNMRISLKEMKFSREEIYRLINMSEQEYEEYIGKLPEDTQTKMRNIWMQRKTGRAELMQNELMLARVSLEPRAERFQDVGVYEEFEAREKALQRLYRSHSESDVEATLSLSDEQFKKFIAQQSENERALWKIARKTPQQIFAEKKEELSKRTNDIKKEFGPLYTMNRERYEENPEVAVTTTRNALYHALMNTYEQKDNGMIVVKDPENEEYLKKTFGFLGNDFKPFAQRAFENGRKDFVYNEDNLILHGKLTTNKAIKKHFEDLYNSPEYANLENIKSIQENLEAVEGGWIALSQFDSIFQEKFGKEYNREQYGDVISYASEYIKLAKSDSELTKTEKTALANRVEELGITKPARLNKILEGIVGLKPVETTGEGGEDGENVTQEYRSLADSNIVLASLVSEIQNNQKIVNDSLDKTNTSVDKVTDKVAEILKK